MDSETFTDLLAIKASETVSGPKLKVNFSLADT